MSVEETVQESELRRIVDATAVLERVITIHKDRSRGYAQDWVILKLGNGPREYIILQRFAEGCAEEYRREILKELVSVAVGK